MLVKRGTATNDFHEVEDWLWPNSVTQASSSFDSVWPDQASTRTYLTSELKELADVHLRGDRLVEDIACLLRYRKGSKMRILLRRADVRVPEQLRDLVETDTRECQPTCERVAKGMVGDTRPRLLNALCGIEASSVARSQECLASILPRAAV